MATKWRILIIFLITLDLMHSANREKEFLRMMADFPQDKAVSMSELADRMGRPLSAISTLRASLIRKGMLYSPGYGEIAYSVPMFADYMKRTMR